jgi:Methyltransferase domain
MTKLAPVAYELTLFEGIFMYDFSTFTSNEPNVPQQMDNRVTLGASLYGPGALQIYDWVVLKLSNPFIWECPTKCILDLYATNISANHLDVGVGTGYFLDHCRFPVEKPLVTLMDLNLDALQWTAERIQRYNPRTWHANVLSFSPATSRRFDSIGLNYLLHCLPGSFASKKVVFDQLVPLLSNGGRLFGTTILGTGIKRNWQAKALMSFYNSKGVFNNKEDSLEELEQLLKENFKTYALHVVGCVAFFVGYV